MRLMLWVALIFDIADIVMHTYSAVNTLLGSQTNLGHPLVGASTIHNYFDRLTHAVA